MRQKFKQYLDKGYNYEEALKRLNIDHNDVVKLRHKIANFPHVPRGIHNKLVSSHTLDLMLNEKLMTKLYI